jgi:hypothetical protein
VYGDASRQFCKLQECVNKCYQHQSLIWDPLNEGCSNNRELNTIHMYINGKPGTPSVHFAFRRLMLRVRYKGIIKSFRNSKHGHQSLITGWSNFSERQYARTFQRRHPTFEQTVQESHTLKGAQFCFGYREEEGGYNTYWAKVVRSDWVHNDDSTPRAPGESHTGHYNWTVTLVLDYCSTVAFFQNDMPNPIATLRQRSQPIISACNRKQQEHAFQEPGTTTSSGSGQARLLGRISSPDPCKRPLKRARSSSCSSSERERATPPRKRERNS